jgi:hypothetical protein
VIDERKPTGRHLPLLWSSPHGADFLPDVGKRSVITFKRHRRGLENVVPALLAFLGREWV